MFKNEGLSMEQTPKPEKEITIEAVYESINSAETKPLTAENLKEKIYIDDLNENDIEFDILKKFGVPEKDLVEHNVVRQQLLKAGFVFNNAPLKFMEKRLIEETINGVDYSKRKLLTQEELNQILEHQRDHSSEYGTNHISSKKQRLSMLSLLLVASNELPDWVANKSSFLRFCVNNVDAPYFSWEGKRIFDEDPIRKKTKKYDKEIVNLFFEYNVRQMNKQLDTMAKEGKGKFSILAEEILANNAFTDIMQWEQPSNSLNRFPIKMRGMHMNKVLQRTSKLNGVASPFLDSPFKFSPEFGNPDLSVLVEDENRMFRINIMSWHLTLHGLSEMGNGLDSHGGQNYNAGNFERYLFEETKVEQTLEQENKMLWAQQKFDLDKLMRDVSQRLIDLSLEWAENSLEAPKDAIILARKIRVLKGEKSKVEVI